MRGLRHRVRLDAAIAAFFVLFVGGCTPLQTATPLQQPSSTGAREQTPAQSARPSASFGQAEVPYLPAPMHIDLCGEPVPLDREAVYERFDREFTLVVYNHAQVYLWLKRMQRYFPMVEQRLAYYGLPGDLKYVAIAESDLLPNACSPKGAAGPWQFMAATGTAYGLGQSRCVDNRFSFQRSTDSAFMLLKNLHSKYHSWPLALAAYNAGDRRVNDAMRHDGSSNYFNLCLPQETERYVFRILAIKAVLSDPGKYGYSLPSEYGYKPMQTDQVSVSLSGPVSLLTIAGAANTTYSEIKRLNPVIRTDVLAAGTYQINLPSGSRGAFERNFKSGGAGMLLAKGGASSEDVRAEEPRAEVKAGPHKSVSPNARKSGLAVRSKGAATNVKAHGGKKKTPKATSAKAKQKAKPAKAVSHKAGGKAGRHKPKTHGGK